jgi:hypothetical protein
MTTYIVVERECQSIEVVVKRSPEKHATRWCKDHPIAVRTQDSVVYLREKVISQIFWCSKLPGSSSHPVGFAEQCGRLDNA